MFYLYLHGYNLNLQFPAFLLRFFSNSGILVTVQQSHLEVREENAFYENDEVYQFLKRDYFDSDFCFQIEKNSLSWDVGLHFHDFFEIEFFLSGSASLVLNNRQYKLSRGCMHLLTPADFHLYHLEKGMECQYVNLRFDDSLLSAELLQILYACPTALLARMEGAAFDQVYREIQLLMEENRRRETGYRIIIRGGLERICLLLLRSTAQQQDLLLGENQRPGS